MKRYFSVLFLFFVLVIPLDGLLSNGARVRASEAWTVAKSSHFIVYYKNAPENFIERVINESEKYYNIITDDLGFTRYNFWLWDNRAKIYIYDDAGDYLTSTGQPGWSGGLAVPKEKTIRTFPYVKGFFETILPHELRHIIFREFVGFDNFTIPIWFDEGMAVYQGKVNHDRIRFALKEAIKNGTFIPLVKLSRVNPQTLDGTDAHLFYTEAAGIVGYLKKGFGEEGFIEFCRQLRDKKDFLSALHTVYGFRDLEELAETWEEYIRD